MGKAVHFHRFLIGFWLCVFSFQGFGSVSADVVVDGTVGQAGQVALPGPDYDIRAEYGEQAGANLFHSFLRFGLDSGESAVFSGPGSVENIISRVTGGEISHINGTLRSTIPGASLFFLNPAGVLFGAEARLELTGGFHVSTADYLKMDDGERFNAVPSPDEILTVHPPKALGFDSPEDGIGEITIDGSYLSASGADFSLIGGNISIQNGAVLELNGGRLDIASVASGGEVESGEAGLILNGFSELGEISITGDAEGKPSDIYARQGNVYIRGGRFYAENAGILATTTASGAETPASEVRIAADRISLAEGTLISTDTFGPDTGASIQLTAGESLDMSASEIRAGAIGYSATGNAGSVNIRAGEFRMTDGARILTESRAKASGDGGDVTVSAADILLSDAQIDTYTAGAGNAGDVTLSAADITLTEGSEIRAHTEGGGDAGNIRLVSSRDIRLSEGSALSTEAENAGGGRIQVDAADRIFISDADISTSVQNGEGKGGDITIGDPERADATHLVFLQNSEITANADEGDGGAIFIAANHYLKDTLSAVTASSRRGNDGTIRVESPDTDVTEDLNVLPTEFPHPENWARTPCAGRRTVDVSRFAVSPRDGIPLQPDDWQPSPLSVPYLVTGFPETVQQAVLKADAAGDSAALFQALTSAPENTAAAVLRAGAAMEAGHYRMAHDILTRAEGDAGADSDPRLRASFFHVLADLHLVMGKTKAAIDAVKKAQTAAEASDSPACSSGVLNHLGIIRAVNRDGIGSRKAFSEALARAEDSGSPALMSILHLNLAKAEAERGETASARKAMKRAAAHLDRMPDTYAKGMGLLTAEAVFRGLPEKEKRLLKTDFGVDGLEEAVRIGRKLRSSRLLALSFGAMSEQAAGTGNIRKAAAWNRQSLFHAGNAHCPAIRLQGMLRMARLTEHLHQQSEAGNLYREAAAGLRAIHSEFFTGVRDRKNRFEKYIHPFYENSIRFFLKSGETAEDSFRRQQAFQEGRELIETLKTLEIQHYFRDECLTEMESERKARQGLPPMTAVLYPVLLKSNPRLLLVLQQEIVTVGIDADTGEIEKTAIDFREQLEYGEPEADFSAGRLYDWLIEPVRAKLEAEGVRTLVIVPDGPLRMIPFSALFDGERYLVESFTLGTTLSMNLTDVQNAGRPGTENPIPGILMAGLSGGSGDFSPLPHVRAELEDLNRLIPGTVLMDDAFTAGNLRREMDTRFYPVVHLATHAVFTGEPEESFLLTYDHRITMNDLDRMVFTGKYRGSPLELLCLSACETAIGDDRAAFGLAGAALKSGAKSILATLWAADDRTTRKAVHIFYTELHNGLAKAEALRTAQLKLMADPHYSHPSQWAFLTLLGKWL